MKILIAVISCRRDRKYHQLLRDTWLKNCPADYKFVLGGSHENVQPDELVVSTGDNYSTLTDKVREAVSFAYDQRYDYLFKLDVDTYCHVGRLLASGFQQHDWSGYGSCYGGSGYWLSRRAMKLLLDNGDDEESRKIHAEDGWVNHVLRKCGLEPYQDCRYHSLTNEGPTLLNDLITSHWYSEWCGSNERIVSTTERIALISQYHKKAQEISIGKP